MGLERTFIISNYLTVVKDCPSGFDELNCGNSNFESGTSGWGNVSTYRQKWLLTRAADALLVNSNAPKVDADERKQGHYLLVGNTALSEFANAEAALNPSSLSMHLKDAYKTCTMQFDYYLKTPAGKGLIKVRLGEDAANWNTVYLIRQQSPEWHRAYAHIGLHYSPFMVNLLGHLEPGASSAAAVDNIQFLNCTFPKSLPKNQSTTCPPDRPFLCSNRNFCISEDELCSYVDECGDGSDERKCLLSQFVCNFEYRVSTCGIQTDPHWYITSGGGVSDESNLPQIDNTK